LAGHVEQPRSASAFFSGETAKKAERVFAARLEFALEADGMTALRSSERAIIWTVPPAA